MTFVRFPSRRETLMRTTISGDTRGRPSASCSIPGSVRTLSYSERESTLIASDCAPTRRATIARGRTGDAKILRTPSASDMTRRKTATTSPIPTTVIEVEILRPKRLRQL